MYVPEFNALCWDPLSFLKMGNKIISENYPRIRKMDFVSKAVVKCCSDSHVNFDVTPQGFHRDEVFSKLSRKKTANLPSQVSYCQPLTHG